MISVFIPYSGYEHTKRTIENIRTSPLVSNIFLLSLNKKAEKIEGTKLIEIDSLISGKTLEQVLKHSDSEYILFITQDNLLDFGQFSLERFYYVAQNTGAGLVYSDYKEIKDQVSYPHPVIDYQIGSLRDDFNFGYVLFLQKTALQEAVESTNKKYKFAGLFNARLKISQNYELLRIPEYLYSTIETDNRKSGAKLFDYVDPKNRDLQLEMEDAVTEHLKSIGAYLEPKFDKIEFGSDNFKIEATVVIPVKNRLKTIADAIDSVLKQKTDFDFNLIVVDNYSNDGTTEKIKEYTKTEKRVILVTPQRKDLGIGGCWNEAVHHDKCGRFAIQLDSDDVYTDETTIQKIVNAFRKEKCAMVIGSYKITNFNLEDIPPGIIDHKEWTPENGRNNALRINGLGAPRAFYTPILRKYKIPNVSYGEDYALGLMISRDYQIGRLYEPIYTCRRWEGNSDAALDIPKLNAHNVYKDRIRSIEVLSRIRKNADA
ncbi:MAG: glycosyltransferase [Bacteroidetes bacterium]|nr:glycosyltransferase [Bacteroidota bacterium]